MAAGTKNRGNSQKRVPIPGKGKKRDEIAEGSFSSGPSAWRYDGGYGKKTYHEAKKK
jgi:hypothetical protein